MEIVIEPVLFTSFGWSVALFVGLALLIIIFAGWLIYEANSIQGVTGLPFSMLAVILFWVVICFAIISGNVENLVRDRQMAELESKGFSHIELVNNKFTASLDGEYFSGRLKEIDTDKYEVLREVDFE